MSQHLPSGSILSYQGIKPRLAESVFVAPNAFVIGDVKMGEGSSVWFSSVIRGDEGAILIGDGSNLQDGCIVHSNKGEGVSIGDNVTVGHGAILHGCTIESGVLIGMGAVILDGAVVERGAQVAAGAVVGPGKRVTANSLWGGCPAKLMREFLPGSEGQFFRSAEGYNQKSQRYLGGEVSVVE